MVEPAVKAMNEALRLIASAEEGKAADWQIVEEIAAGDVTREVLAGMASITAVLISTLARLLGVTPETVLGQLAGEVDATIADVLREES